MAQKKLSFDDIITMSWDWRVPVLIAKAHEASVFDTASGGWKDCAWIAEKLESDLRVTRLLLLGLCGAGVMEKSGDNFRNTEMTERYLVKSSPDYRGHVLGLSTRQMKNWLLIPEVLKTGEPIPKPEMGPEEEDSWTEVFLLAMKALSERSVTQLFNALPLKDGMRMLDVGAGPATYLIEFAKRLPRFKGVAFDRPTADPVSERFAVEAGVFDRINFVAGDFTKDTFNGPFDGALLSNIIHIISSTEACGLIKRVASAIRPGGFIAISEMAVGPDDDPGIASVFAVQMMLGTKTGGVYTRDEMMGWLIAEGFVIDSVAVLNERSEVIVGRKKESE